VSRVAGTVPPRHIASGDQLRRFAEQVRVSGRLAIDTEFMGEGRYRTMLCLIQLATPTKAPAGEAWIELVDPLDDCNDLAILALLISDPDVELIVHAGRQDVALLRRTLGCLPRTVFDTQLAAGFVGMPAQGSYESLLAELLGIKLAKSASFTRWDARPLSPEQLAYAREDVVHLIELADELERRLSALGRLQWARQECEPLELSSDERDLDAIFSRLPRARGLSPASQAVARALVQWREQTAERRDRPVQSVVHDAALVEIAKRRPTTPAQLKEIRGVAQSLLYRNAAEVLRVIADARNRAPQPPARTSPTSTSDPSDAPLIALGEALVRTRTREAGIAYELLAARADLQAVVAARREGAPEPDVRTLRGWRRELVGDELLELLDGRIALSVSDGQLRIDR
jgi:ribonuclease D